MSTRRRWRIPEVVQTSFMDCGPAALTALLRGFGRPCNYARLREACHTDLDGTSIDTLEEVAQRLQLDAEQVIVPIDHVLLDASRCLPALVVTMLPDGSNHFVAVWRRLGDWVQIMDPATGRKWVRRASFLGSLYRHEMSVPASDWDEWARGDEAQQSFAARLGALGIDRAPLATAVAEPGPHALARLDAATRLTAALCAAGGCDRGDEAGRMLARFAAATGDDLLARHAAAAVDPDDADALRVRGAVLVRFRDRAGPLAGATDGGGAPSAELAAICEPPPRPLRELARLALAGGRARLLGLLGLLGLAALGLVIESLALRALIGAGTTFTTLDRRLGALGFVLALALALLLLEGSLKDGVRRLGRDLELRLRIAFLRKLPRLGDRYLESRPTADMASRAHHLHEVREFPADLAVVARSGLEIALLAAAIIWLAPTTTGLALVAAAVAGLAPLLLYKPLRDLDYVRRTYLGSQARFYLDALLGLVPIRAHAAERSVETEHELQLSLVRQIGRRHLLWLVTAEGAHLALGLGLAAAIVTRGLASDVGGGLILLAYWAVALPLRGQLLLRVLLRLPGRHNVLLRVLEPLHAPEDEGVTDASAADAPSAPPAPASHGVAIELVAANVVVAGTTLLHDLAVAITPGQHVAVVGRSGSGKSSFLGLLLGFHRVARGHLTLDGGPPSPARLEALRRQIAWVDPAVQLWDRSVLDNVSYGSAADELRHLPVAIRTSDLHSVLLALPSGLQSDVGEGGSLVSGGQGQRVRLARAMLRPDARLVLLDEPFRGLERPARQRLLARARALWPRATLLCVTHDVDLVADFDRVLVFEDGTIAEDGAPAELAARDGRYAALVAAAAYVQEHVWGAAHWRSLWLGPTTLADTEAVIEHAHGKRR